jgi:predicted glycogen debranching enzyme
VGRGSGKTIIAGYPWFTDWGRDTFISMRGLCLAGERLEDARKILTEWANHVSEGMLPNRFPDGNATPEYNSVDASLWYVVAVADFFRHCEANSKRIPAKQQEAILQACRQIVSNYRSGTRYGIRAATDGLLSHGSSGSNITWMDAKCGHLVFTPRVGKAVEIQALWYNAHRILEKLDSNGGIDYGAQAAAIQESFLSQFWNPPTNCLCDVIDNEHKPGQRDSSIRPNQVFAVGGLPYALVEGEKAKAILDVVERELLTPLGMRTLSSDDLRYRPRYEGDPFSRDSSYHQGTVWPWLIGSFVEGWVRVRGSTPDAKAQARERFLPALHEHLHTAGLGHVSEIADATPPFTPRGCPFQAWSLGELLRLENEILI